MTSYLGAFHAKWECPAKPSGRTGARAQMDALAALDLVVPGETIWRAIFDPTRPGEAERFMGDTALYAITGSDSIETRESPRPVEKGSR